MKDKLKQLTLALEKHIEQFAMSNEGVSGKFQTLFNVICDSNFHIS